MLPIGNCTLSLANRGSSIQAQFGPTECGEVLPAVDWAMLCLTNVYVVVVEVAETGHTGHTLATRVSQTYMLYACSY